MQGQIHVWIICPSQNAVAAVGAIQSRMLLRTLFQFTDLGRLCLPIVSPSG